MAEKGKILIVEDDVNFAERLKKNLELEGFIAEVAEGGRAGLSALQQKFYDLVIVDIKMPDLDGLEVLRQIKASDKPEFDSEIPVVMLTSINDISVAVEAMRLGAADYITKESERREIIIRLLRVLEQNRLLNENRLLRAQLERSSEFGEIIGQSEAIRKIKQEILEITGLNVPVLIYGETGVGKELVARAIHRLSKFQGGAFIDLNCAALPEDTLFQSELFGHEKGAFTDAHTARRGKFELAHNGTLFFDEIAELSLDSQAKILRVIETLEFTRIGGNQPIKVNCRLIFATNKELKQLVSEGRFRQDLFFRLTVFPIYIPPLRERVEDIPLLAVYFLKQYCQKYNRPLKNFTESALVELKKYSWPGNVRELKNVVERLVIRSRKPVIDRDEVNECGVQALESETEKVKPLVSIPAQGISMDELEKELVMEALRKTDWNQKEAAKLLGISIDRMHNRIRKFGITHPSWRVHR
ncbi:MAG: sigma-54 dependent transcriptional regulator [Candidatus Sumerlaeia bacterium]|nr:sigma-54 dependent transcriptional regulator [Candidatus Sumerlaeia bacterium]